MWPPIWAHRITHLARRSREQIESPRRLGLLARMVLWGMALRLLRPVMPLHSLVRIATMGAAGQNLASADVLACLQALDGSGLLPRARECLPRALVCYRYLSLAGLQPSLLIGFNGQRGHAWIRLSGQTFLESPEVPQPYQPTLILPPGSRSLQKALKR